MESRHSFITQIPHPRSKPATLHLPPADYVLHEEVTQHIALSVITGNLKPDMTSTKLVPPSLSMDGCIEEEQAKVALMEEDEPESSADSRPSGNKGKGKCGANGKGKGKG